MYVINFYLIFISLNRTFTYNHYLFILFNFEWLIYFLSHLVAPKVLEKFKKIFTGINQTRTVNCTVLHANPPYIRYAINNLSPSVLRRTYGDNHDLQYKFDITPTSTDQFGVFSVSANNSIGFDTCTYELIHGGEDKLIFFQRLIS